MTKAPLLFVIIVIVICCGTRSSIFACSKPARESLTTSVSLSLFAKITNYDFRSAHLLKTKPF